MAGDPLRTATLTRGSSQAIPDSGLFAQSAARRHPGGIGVVARGSSEAGTTFRCRSRGPRVPRRLRPDRADCPPHPRSGPAAPAPLKPHVGPWLDPPRPDSRPPTRPAHPPPRFAAPRFAARAHRVGGERNSGWRNRDRGTRRVTGGGLRRRGPVSAELGVVKPEPGPGPGLGGWPARGPPTPWTHVLRGAGGKRVGGEGGNGSTGHRSDEPDTGHRVDSRRGSSGPSKASSRSPASSRRARTIRMGATRIASPTPFVVPRANASPPPPPERAPAARAERTRSP